ncbi:succinate dehydrogenase / fumarate reductase cytochrome b subunit [Flavobacterium croceum DSM 17960]|uniref:Succinate dehydrogenase / fumarate reductase cytochrome b subunit n=1 Tax=Flavobacterium croceum DSM 17960 TaxID=1121886 RepID=A0A2S4N669_9FLAO|nr:succinate dehydrogenase cytochrome b subunit [Flavobacterium croceum]POS01204.1 succinate dehydrogenase / fumarate reductase cytochrome b subunit [Flavobacterium croceum DSM 17960]
MAKSALLKSSIAKKYWMALTGLFLCLFLAGHLAGNLQLIFSDAKHFNDYALFMTTNPAVKILSYLTYVSILFHAIDGIMLTIQNKAARPVGYAKTDGSSSSLASRNMAVLGTIILVFIVTHMVNFWAKMHFDKNMPLVVKEMNNGMMAQKLAVGTKDSPNPMFNVDEKGSISDKILNDIKTQSQGQYDLYKKDVVTIVNKKDGEVIFIGQKDLHKITVAFFKDAKTGLLATILYVLAMGALAFHLWHGFQSAFQSLGINNKFTPAIKGFGKLFAIVVPILFAIIPIIIHFKK